MYKWVRFECPFRYECLYTTKGAGSEHSPALFQVGCTRIPSSRSSFCLFPKVSSVSMLPEAAAPCGLGMFAGPFANEQCAHVLTVSSLPSPPHKEVCALSPGPCPSEPLARSAPVSQLLLELLVKMNYFWLSPHGARFCRENRM